MRSQQQLVFRGIWKEGSFRRQLAQTPTRPLLMRRLLVPRKAWRTRASTANHTIDPSRYLTLNPSLSFTSSSSLHAPVHPRLKQQWTTVRPRFAVPSPPACRRRKGQPHPTSTLNSTWKASQAEEGIDDWSARCDSEIEQSPSLKRPCNKQQMTTRCRPG